MNMEISENAQQDFAEQFQCAIHCCDVHGKARQDLEGKTQACVR
jgi:hypothetical protein